MKAQIHVLVTSKDKRRYMVAAKRAGLTLSAWLSIAAQEKLQKDNLYQAIVNLDGLIEHLEKADELSLEPPTTEVP